MPCHAFVTLSGAFAVHELLATDMTHLATEGADGPEAAVMLLAVPTSGLQ